MHRRVLKSARRIVRAADDSQAGPAHPIPGAGVSADDLRGLHVLPDGYVHRSVTSLQCAQVFISTIELLFYVSNNDCNCYTYLIYRTVVI